MRYRRAIREAVFHKACLLAETHVAPRHRTLFLMLVHRALHGAVDPSCMIEHSELSGASGLSSKAAVNALEALHENKLLRLTAFPTLNSGTYVVEFLIWPVGRGEYSIDLWDYINE